MTIGQSVARDWRRLAHLSVVVAAMGLVASLLVADEGAALQASPVVISADREQKQVLEGQRVYFEIRLTNTDTQYANQTVTMKANFLSGAPWDHAFAADGEGNPLPPVNDAYSNGTLMKDTYVENGTLIPSGTTKTIYFWVDVPPSGHPQDPRRIQVVGYDNYGHLTQGSNVTKKSDGNSLILTVTAVREYDVKVTLDPTSQAGNINLYQDEGTLWGFTIENTGFKQNAYTLEGRAYKVGSVTPLPWNITFPGGNILHISGTETIGGTHKIETLMIVTPIVTATPRVYEIEVRATGFNSSKFDRTDAQIPLPDFVIGTGDVTLSHSVVCVPCKVDGQQQSLTIYARVRNDGGNSDNSGRPTRHMDVTFTALNADDLSPTGDVNNTGSNSDTFYLPSLNHGEERTVKLKFTPNPIEEAVATLHILVSIDQYNDPDDPQDMDIGESNANNNYHNTTFRLVRTYSAGEPSAAIINYVSHAVQAEGQPVTFKGRDFDDSEASYRWESDRDGLLGSRRVLVTDKLSVGVHNITLYYESGHSSQIGVDLMLSRSGRGGAYAPPQGAFTASKGADATWYIQVVKMSPAVSVTAVDFYLLGPDGVTVKQANTAEVYGYFLGQGQGVVFADNDFNGKVSPGDMFTLHGGEVGDADMAGISSLDGYKFRLKLRPFSSTSEAVRVEIVPDDGTFGDPEGPHLTLVLVLGVALALAGVVAGWIFYSRQNGIGALVEQATSSPTNRGPPADSPVEPATAQAPTNEPPPSEAPADGPAGPAPGPAPAMTLVACPNCSAHLEVPQLGHSQRITCHNCGISGRAEV